jgi:tetratricopeptide (TPR) repeat protein
VATKRSTLARLRENSLCTIVTRFVLRPSALAAGFLALFGCGDRSPDFTPEELAEATAQVREAYYVRDYYYGAELGGEWTALAPDAMEVRAWTAANLVLTHIEQSVPRMMAEEMVATHPESPWSWFALAHNIAWDYPYRNGDEAMEVSGKALSGLPENPDALILHAEVLLRYAGGRNFGPEGRRAAQAFLDAFSEEVRRNSDIRAFMAYRLAPSGRDRTEAALQEIIGNLEEILSEDPDHILAHYYLGSILRGIEGEKARARTHLEQAAAASPSSGIHFSLWNDIVYDPGLDEEEKRSKVSADVRHVLEDFPESPSRWAYMAIGLGSYGYPGLKNELEERILLDYPESWGAEEVLIDRISWFASELHDERPADHETFVEESAQLEGMVRSFLARPEHRDPGGVQDAFWNLFLLEKERPEVDYAELGRLAETWAEYLPQVRDRWADQKCILGALILAQHPQTLDAAKTLLEAGRKEMEEFAEEFEFQRPNLIGRSLESREDHIRSSNAYLSIASSLVLAQEGLFEEAETALSQARSYDPEDDDSWTILPLGDFASGKIKELRADFSRENGDGATAQRLLTSAEEFYIHGLRGAYFARPGYGVGWTNPNEVALRDLFEKREGTLEGFEGYLASAKEGGWEKRRAEVLASQIKDPKPIRPFALKNLEGEEVTSESYLGKVVVVNFWGTW